MDEGSNALANHESTVSTVTILINVWAGDSPIRLRKSLESTMIQSLSPTKLLVVVDGPISNALEDELAHFQRSTLNMKIVRNSMNLGLAVGRNIGFLNSTTEFVLLHDADDVMHPRRLEIQLADAIARNLDISFSAAFEFDSETERLLGVRSIDKDQLDFKRYLYWNNAIPHSSVLVRRQTAINSGLYRQVMFAEDYDLWLRMVKRGVRIGATREILQALSVDDSHYHRRSGFKLVKSEYAIHQSIKLVFPNRRTLNLLRFNLRCLFRLMPVALKPIARVLVRRSETFGLKTVREFLECEPRKLLH